MVPAPVAEMIKNRPICTVTTGPTGSDSSGYRE